MKQFIPIALGGFIVSSIFGNKLGVIAEIGDVEIPTSYFYGAILGGIIGKCIMQ